ncbi:hypothetical protein RUND412_004857 [Rhizina undulata]
MHYKTLFVSSLLAVVASAQSVTTGALGNAAVVTDNPIGKTYVATFPSNGTVSGTVSFTASSNGTGVEVTVDLSGFVGIEGPFGYHIHDQPVPASGNCNGTLAHLDPYQRGQEVPCDKAYPATCEVGDLSGKHGAIPNGNGSFIDFHAAYVDLYISTLQGIGAFLGNRSIVIHRPDKSRIICANITEATREPSGPSTNSVVSTEANAAVTFGLSSTLAVGSIFAAFIAAF